MKRITQQQKDELSAHFNTTEEQIEKAAQLIFDGSLEKDIEKLESLIGAERERCAFRDKFFADPIKTLAFDILMYYGKIGEID